MRFIVLFFLLTIFSCDPFEKNNVLKYQNDLYKIINKLEPYENVTLNRNEINELNVKDLSNLSIDLIVKNLNKKNPTYSGFIEENDSLVIFIQKSNHIFDLEKRIIYDFSKEPKNYGSSKVLGASYMLEQLNERWYYSEVGFD